jgi:hypothetical protein
MKIRDLLSINNSILFASTCIGLSIVHLSNSIATLNMPKVASEIDDGSYFNAIKTSQDVSSEAVKMGRFRLKFDNAFPSLRSADINPTKSDMLWAVTYNGSTIYFTSDLKVALNGTLSHIPKLEPLQSIMTGNQEKPIATDSSGIDKEKAISIPNPPNRHTGVVRPSYAEGLATVDKTLLPFFKATNNRDDLNPKSIITFIDISCPACKRFISKIPELNELGIDVYLAPFPRGGSSSSVAKVMASAWCSGDNDTRKENVLKALSGRLLPANCDSDAYRQNIEKSFHFGDKFLNKTTPVSFTQNGIIVIANLDVQGFLDAFSFGDALADYVASTNQNPS